MAYVDAGKKRHVAFLTAIHHGLRLLPTARENFLFCVLPESRSRDAEVI